MTDEKPDRKQRPRIDEKFKIFSGTANEPLADEVCQFLGMHRGQAQVTRFADGECYVQIQENVRGADVFVMQPTCRPVDEHLMELLLMIDALKRASARRITAVIPYFGYARQDRKDKPRSPISSKLVADLLTTAGAHRALIVDLHTPQLQGFFNIPVDHLFASPVLVDHFRKLQLPNLTVVSPDAGGVERAQVFREEGGRGAGHCRQAARRNECGRDYARDRRRSRADLLDHRRLDRYGGNAGEDGGGADGEWRDCRFMHARRMRCCRDRRWRTSQNSVIKEVVVTNTIPLSPAADAARTEKGGKITVLSIAGLIGRAIQANHEETSVSKLFI